jgi:hypothetical protein
MIHVLKVLLMWSLSPIGTLLNTGLLAVTMLLAGTDPHSPIFWVPLAVFLGFSGFLDVSAYITQRRKGLSAFAVADAVFERLWPTSRDPEEERADG